MNRFGVATGHSPHLSHPDPVAELVEQLTTAHRPR